MIQPQAYWQEFECPSSAHTAYVSGGLVVLVLYATIAVRMLVTGAGLAGVSLKINFFDWGHDEHHLARDRHVLSQNINRCVCVFHGPTEASSPQNGGLGAWLDVNG